MCIAASAALAASASRAEAAPVVTLDASDLLGVEASSAAPGGSAANVGDGDATTVWSSAPDDTIGASVTLRFRGTRYVLGVELLPVRRAGAGSFKFVGRPASVRVTAGDASREVELPDAPTPVRVAWPVAVPASAVRIEVLAVHGAYRRVGLLEVRVDEPSDVLAADPALAARVAADLDRVMTSGDEVARRQLVAYGRPALGPLDDAIARRCEAAGHAAALAATHNLSPDAARAALSGLLASDDARCVDSGLGFLERHPLSGLDDGLLAVTRTFATSDPTRVLRAAELLARARDARVMPVLARVFADDADPARAERAAVLLSSAFGADGIALLEQRAAGDAAHREIAVRALAQLDTEPGAVAALSRIADGAGASRLALSAIAGMDAARAMETLQPIIAHDRQRRAAALAAMVEHRLIDPVTLDWLAWIPEAEHPALIEALGALRNDGALRTLAALIVAMPERTQQVLATDALVPHGETGLAAVVAVLDAHTERAWAAEGYVDALAARAPEAVARVLRATAIEARLDDILLAMAHSLGRSGGVGQVDAVYRIYRHPDATPRMRRRALEALAHMPAQSVLPTIAADIGHHVDDLDPLRYAVLANAGSPEQRASVFERVARTAPDLWSTELVLALGEVDPNRALAVFGDRFIFLPRRVQLAVLEVAHLARSQAGLELLFTAATSNDASLRRRALDCLSRGSGDATPPRVGLARP